ncbi:restriction endonuclease subunit S [Cellulomonas oligotrophica]|uniref:Uncharacterized protein n=1 Tax=Cellulomonas oligotrophica TaxID=931536 RepID=A0A7Y9JZL9_9CELL|nr:restriction endonuclease subunit S [Cellulomonas oligotrophica]NYD86944.1 hypothetical protein [Cellulomonas oligotrophica]GIG32270.1 hypothetical protein Col01nite_14290 [Cellulomonas oligotrophica]
MGDLIGAFARLDEARARHRLVPAPPGLPEKQVVDLLSSAGVHPHAHLVAWYARYGPTVHGPLVPGVFVEDLRAEIEEYACLCEIVEDHDRDVVAHAQTVDWFPLGREQSSLTVMWARECSGDPALAAQNELAALEPTPHGDPVTLPELLMAWVTRLDLGYYTPSENGTIPWFDYRMTEIDGRRRYDHVLSDDIRRRTGL